MSDEPTLDEATLDLYLESYNRHREAGDDPMNARLRIVEEGCPVAISHQIQDAFAEED